MTSLLHRNNIPLSDLIDGSAAVVPFFGHQDLRT
jgi:hypothetical protein